MQMLDAANKIIFESMHVSTLKRFKAKVVEMKYIVLQKELILSPTPR